MNNYRTLTGIAVAGAIALGTAFAQAQQSTPAPQPAPRPGSAVTRSSPPAPSAAEQVETWTTKQWEAAKKEWAKDKTKWTGCRKQSNAEKLKGRKSWSFLYKCMTG